MVLGTPTPRTPASIGDGLCVVAADGDQGVQLIGLEDLHAFLNAAFDLADVGARGAQDGAALVENAVDFFHRQRDGVVVEHAAPAFEEADKLVSIMGDAFFDDRMNHGIQTWAVSAAR
jgi:hypothetical protein